MEKKEIWFKEGITTEQVNKRGENTATDFLDIVITEIGDSFLKGTMPVNNKTVQPARILHGGVSCVLAESLGSIASNMVVDWNEKVAVGQSITANHLRPAKEGDTVTGIARPVHLGKKSHVWDIEIFDSKGNMTCTSRLTMAIIKK